MNDCIHISIKSSPISKLLSTLSMHARYGKNIERTAVEKWEETYTIIVSTYTSSATYVSGDVFWFGFLVHRRQEIFNKL